MVRGSGGGCHGGVWEGGGREATVRVIKRGWHGERGDPPWIWYVWGRRGSHDGGDGRGDQVVVGAVMVVCGNLGRVAAMVVVE